jgi:FixJ family two-component response regulator
MWHLKRHADQHSSRHADQLEIVAILGDAIDRRTMQEFGAGSTWKVNIAGCLDDGARAAANGTTAVVILDRELAEQRGHDWREAVHAFAHGSSNPCVLLVSAVIDGYLFEEVVKQGGFDVISRPLAWDEVRRLSSLAVAYWRNLGSGKSRQSTPSE